MIIYDILSILQYQVSTTVIRDRPKLLFLVSAVTETGAEIQFLVSAVTVTRPKLTNDLRL